MVALTDTHLCLCIVAAFEYPKIVFCFFFWFGITGSGDGLEKVLIVDAYITTMRASGTEQMDVQSESKK